jgi:uncharacterized membrane protein YcaP (DUF421 family)
MDILIPDIAISEKVVRSLVVYVFLLVAFRVAGKRQLGQLTAFDLVALLIISNVLQSAAIGNDNSLGGLIGAFVIIALNWLVAWSTFRHMHLQRMVENVPILVKHGHVLHGNLDREHMSMAELRAALGTEGITTMSEVPYAILKEDGRVSVIRRSVLPA